MSEDNWKYTAVILCGVGLFKEFIPSAPFLLEYAVEHRNFTSEVVRSFFTALYFGFEIKENTQFIKVMQVKTNVS